MRLSIYIAKLQELQQQLAPEDPEVAIYRPAFSDLTTDIGEGYPCIAKVLPPAGGRTWPMRSHPRMSERQKEQLVPVVELAEGN